VACCMGMMVCVSVLVAVAAAATARLLFLIHR